MMQGFFDMKFTTSFLILLAHFLLLGPAQARADLKSAAPSATTEGEKSPRFIIHLLDYLAKDYGGAVQNGKVISATEYDEQVEFSNRVLKTAGELEALRSSSALLASIQELSRLIGAKADAGKVAQLARKIQSEVQGIARLPVSPERWPNLETGRALFARNCASCHGAQGRGDGAAGANLDPKPANFLDAAFIEAASPFQSYNVVRLGVPGTGMAPYPQLSDEETWSLAFFIHSLRWEGKPVAKPEDFASKKESWLSTAASLQDAAILRGPSDLSDEALAFLRTFSEKQDSRASLLFAQEAVNDSVRLYLAGSLKEAEARALQAYLDGIEPVETRIRSNDGELVGEIEVAMAAVRADVSRAGTPETELRKHADAALAQIDRAMALLQQKPLTSGLVFASSFSILIREGFEAVFIILALLGVVRSLGEKKAERFVHVGWIVAIATGFAAWFASGALLSLSSAGREVMEGAISLVAVFVLLYLGFWMHRQTEIKRWTAFIHGRVRTLLSGNRLWGLAAISFTAVFREAFETVLFLRAMALEGTSHSDSMLAGIGLAFAVIFIASALLLKFGKRLPLRQWFLLSSLIMSVLAVVLAGKGMHALQEAGYVPVTTFLPFLRSDLFGVFPTLETLAPQFLVLAIVALTLGLGARRRGREPGAEVVAG